LLNVNLLVDFFIVCLLVKRQLAVRVPPGRPRVF